MFTTEMKQITRWLPRFKERVYLSALVEAVKRDPDRKALIQLNPRDPMKVAVFVNSFVYSDWCDCTDCVKFRPAREKFTWTEELKPSHRRKPKKGRKK